MDGHPGVRGSTLTSQTRVIMTSVDFMRAAAVWPLRSCISRTASAVMMEVMRCGGREAISRTTLARRPASLTSTMVPTIWLRPLVVRKRSREAGVGARGRGGEVAGEGGVCDAVVAAGGLDGLELTGEDPLLDGGVADADGGGGLAGGEELGGGFHWWGLQRGEVSIAGGFGFEG